MSRLATLKNLLGGPLANAKAVRFYFLLHVDSDCITNFLLQYAKNLYETEPAIAWSFTIGLAGIFVSV
jgi:hypothetical protein